MAILDSLCQFVEERHSLAGLDGVFLNAARAAQYGPSKDSVARAAQLWAGAGLPNELGGGALTSALFDVGTGILSFATAQDITSALESGTTGWLGMPGLTMDMLTGRGSGGAGLLGLDLLFSGTMPVERSIAGMG